MHPSHGVVAVCAVMALSLVATPLTGAPLETRIYSCPSQVRGRLVFIEYPRPLSEGHIAVYSCGRGAYERISDIPSSGTMGPCAISGDASCFAAISTPFYRPGDAYVPPRGNIYVLDRKSGKDTMVTVDTGELRGLTLGGESLFVCLQKYKHVSLRFDWETAATTRTVSDYKCSLIEINLADGTSKDIPVDGIAGGEGSYPYPYPLSKSQNGVVYFEWAAPDYPSTYYRYDRDKYTCQRLCFPEFSLDRDGRFIFYHQTVWPNELLAITKSSDMGECLSPYKIESYSGKKEVLLEFTSLRSKWYGVIGLSPCGGYYAFSEITPDLYRVNVFDLATKKVFPVVDVPYKDVCGVSCFAWIE